MLKHLARFLPLSPTVRITQDGKEVARRVAREHFLELHTSGRDKGSPGTHSLYPFRLPWLALFVVSVSDPVELSSLTSRRPLLSPRPGRGVYGDSPVIGT